MRIRHRNQIFTIDCKKPRSYFEKHRRYWRDYFFYKLQIHKLKLWGFPVSYYLFLSSKVKVGTYKPNELLPTGTLFLLLLCMFFDKNTLDYIVEENKSGS